jgi:hypothetical protein
MNKNDSLQSNTYDAAAVESPSIQDRVLHIQLLTRNTIQHLNYYEVTPLLGKKNKWKERAMMLFAGLDLAIADLLDSNHNNQFLEPLKETIGNIDHLASDFMDRLSNSQNKEELLGLNAVADGLDISLQNLERLTKVLQEKSQQ